ncbi:MAG: hypothetical protein M1834_007535 [Cirrosporium novae-zelandiae]|nr:MAG: hypothetical protein M1834_007535 [Cirrosporium novae-zelandiae]
MTLFGLGHKRCVKEKYFDGDQMPRRLRANPGAVGFIKHPFPHAAYRSDGAPIGPFLGEGFADGQNRANRAKTQRAVLQNFGLAGNRHRNFFPVPGPPYQFPYPRSLPFCPPMSYRTPYRPRRSGYRRSNVRFATERGGGFNGHGGRVRGGGRSGRRRGNPVFGRSGGYGGYHHRNPRGLNTVEFPSSFGGLPYMDEPRHRNAFRGDQRVAYDLDHFPRQMRRTLSDVDLQQWSDIDDSEASSGYESMWDDDDPFEHTYHRRGSYTRTRPGELVFDDMGDDAIYSENEDYSPYTQPRYSNHADGYAGGAGGGGGHKLYRSPSLDSETSLLSRFDIPNIKRYPYSGY